LLAVVWHRLQFCIPAADIPTMPINLPQRQVSSDPATLVKLKAAEIALPKANLRTAGNIHKLASTAVVWHQKFKQNLAEHRKWAVLKLRAEWRVGHLLNSVEPQRGGSKGRGAPLKDALDSLGADKKPAREWRRLAKVPKAFFENCLATADGLGGLTSAAVLQAWKDHQRSRQGLEPQERVRPVPLHKQAGRQDRATWDLSGFVDREIPAGAQPHTEDVADIIGRLFRRWAGTSSEFRDAIREVARQEASRIQRDENQRGVLVVNVDMRWENRKTASRAVWHSGGGDAYAEHQAYDPRSEVLIAWLCSAFASQPTCVVERKDISQPSGRKGDGR